MASQVFTLGGTWKGIGNSWINDDPGACVDCLNVLTSRDGQWLQSRPGFKDTKFRGTEVDYEYPALKGMACVRRYDNDKTLGVIAVDGQGWPKVKINDTTAVISESTFSGAYPRVADDPFVGHEGGMTFVNDRRGLHMFSRTKTMVGVWRFNGFEDAAAATTYLPIMECGAVPEFTYDEETFSPGLQGKTFVDMEGSANVAASGDSPWNDPDGSGWDAVTVNIVMDWVPVMRDPDGNLLAVDFPAKDWQSDLNDVVVPVPCTLALQEHAILDTAHRVVANREELGCAITNYTVEPDPATNGYDHTNRGQFFPTHKRNLRNTLSGPELLYIEGEYKINQLESALWEKTDTDHTYSIPNMIDPVTLWLDGTALTEAVSVVACKATASTWFFDSGTSILYFHTSEDKPHYDYELLFKEGKIQCGFAKPDSELITEHADYRSCPAMMWLGVVHNNRLFVAASDNRTSWGKVADVYMSLTNNFFLFNPNDYFNVGNGETITGMASLTNLNALLITTTKEACLLLGKAASNFELISLGPETGCHSYAGVGALGSRALWFDHSEAWLFDGGNLNRVTPALLRPRLAVLVGDTHEGHGYVWNGQFWYRRYDFTYDATTHCGLVYDFNASAFWWTDRVVEASYDAAPDVARYAEDIPNYSWTDAGDAETARAFALMADPDDPDVPVAMGQAVREDVEANSYTHYDQFWNGTTSMYEKVNITRTWVSSWMDFGVVESKKILKARIFCSENTECELVVEGHDYFTESSTLIPNNVRVKLGGHAGVREAEIDLAAKYLRFRINGINDSELRVRSIEFDLDIA